MPQDILKLHVNNWQKETAEHSTELQDFLSWFDTAESSQASYMSGWWDFSFHILKPKLVALLGEPFDKTALEIGYGAGRLLVPACRYFRKCIGIDIHQFKKKVREQISLSGVTNFALYQTEGSSIPLENESIDFIYTFIVLQHLPTIEVFKDYLAEFHRVMKRGAVAIVYMGFLPGKFRRKYLDLSTQKVSTIRRITLRMTVPLASTLLSAAGFEVVDLERSQKKPWLTQWGEQFYAIIRKEN